MSTIREALAAPWPVRSRTAAQATSVRISAHRSSLRGFALIMGALIVALSGLLMALNIVLVHGAFAVQSMQTQSQSLERAQQALGDAVATGESPAQLAQRAAALGMRPAVKPVFLRLTNNGDPIVSNRKDSAAVDNGSTAAMPH
ncbi:MAG: hypothetical protein EBU85_00840 [Actinobacteria bacterium]|nr:hypothetical protein [Actinomycetota bacterium]